MTKLDRLAPSFALLTQVIAGEAAGRTDRQTPPKAKSGEGSVGGAGAHQLLVRSIQVRSCCSRRTCSKLYSIPAA